MPLDDVFDAYRETRAAGVNTSVVCHAPFVSLNFSQNGTVTSCCYNRSEVLGAYPADDVASIWNGARARAFREAFLRRDTARGCELCFHQLRSGNFGGVLMRNFDRFATDDGYEPARDIAAPRVLEFEIANTCNLQCVMCDGDWSSSIRAHREGRPPLHSPYDEAFVEQLAPFLPSIRAAKFLGGEPFLITRYYEIWERLLQVNPDAELTITTNGTRFPARARELLDGLRVNIVVSLDSLDAATFEHVRVGARFDEVMANVETFSAYAARRGTDLAIAVCPMQANWKGLPDLARFCLARRLWIHFNTVTRPASASLAALPIAELGRVIEYLEANRPHYDSDWWGAEYNRRAWDGLVSQLRTWHARKMESADRAGQMERQVRTRIADAGDLAITDTGRQALSFVIRSFCMGRNLAALEGEPIELTRLVVEAPAVEESAEAFGTIDLLRALYWLCRVVDEQGPVATMAPAFERCVEALRGDAGALDLLHRWLTDRMRRGQWVETARWLEALLDVADHPVRWRRALTDGVAVLRTRGYNDRDCRAALGHLARMVPFAPLPPPAAREAGDTGITLTLKAEDAQLARIFDAMYLFSCGSRIDADQEAFRLRLDTTLDLIRLAGLERAVSLSLTRTDPLAAFDAFVNSTDDQLAGLVEQSRAMAAIP